MIFVKGVHKSFKDVPVLRGVDLDVQTGSIHALLGSNGAGKTTLMRILATLLRPDNGTATVAGFDVSTEPKRVRNAISLTGQFTAVDDILTGRENLILMARLRHLPNPPEIADELLARFSLSDAADRRTATYSGGDAPPAGCRDEPDREPARTVPRRTTTGLDPQSRLEVWDCIRELAGQGTTVLLTTQYLDEAEHLADRIAILHDGRIIVDGTLADLKALLPPATIEYVEKQPSLEEVFLAVVGAR